MKVPIAQLRPTQVCVGFYEVRKKLSALKELSGHPEKLKDYKRLNPAPVIKGPGSHLYIIDHHHLSSALLRLKEKDIYVKLIKDYSNLPKKEFEGKMLRHQWVYLKDHHGKEVTFDDLPDSIDKLQNDPYRSLAGIVRDRHGFKKTAVPFIEFQWADFFRSRKILGDDNKITKRGILKALVLTRSKAAKSLPGWIQR